MAYGDKKPEHARGKRGGEFSYPDFWKKVTLVTFSECPIVASKTVSRKIRNSVFSILKLSKKKDNQSEE